MLFKRGSQRLPCNIIGERYIHILMYETLDIHLRYCIFTVKEGK